MKIRKTTKKEKNEREQEGIQYERVVKDGDKNRKI